MAANIAPKAPAQEPPKGSGDKRRRATHIWAPDPFGHYPEQEWASARLFEVESFGDQGDLIVDLCCGWGRILHAAAAGGYSTIGCDLVDRRRDPHIDNGFKFVSRRRHRRPAAHRFAVSVVINPPFAANYIEKFVKRALAIAEYKVAALVPLRRLPAARWLLGLPLKSIYLLRRGRRCRRRPTSKLALSPAAADKILLADLQQVDAADRRTRRPLALPRRSERMTHRQTEIIEVVHAGEAVRLEWPQDAECAPPGRGGCAQDTGRRGL